MIGQQIRILIYTDDQPAAIRISALCRQLGMSSEHLHRASEAELFIHQEDVRLIVVDLAAPVVSIPEGVRCLAIARGLPSEYERLSRYQPHAVMGMASVEALLVSQLARVAGPGVGFPSFPCAFVDMAARLQELQVRLLAVRRDKWHQQAGSELAAEYCAKHCACSMPAATAAGDLSQGYEPIPLIAGEPARVCCVKKPCPLFRFQQYAVEQTFSSGRGAGSFLDQPFENDKEFSLADLIAETRRFFESIIELTVTARRSFCEKECCPGVDVPVPPAGEGNRPCSRCQCVLKDCLRIIPQKELLARRKALVFENSPDDIAAIETMCAEFNLTPVRAADPKAAAEVLRDPQMVFAFINPLLGAVELPARMGAVILDDGSVGIVATMVAYRAIRIIPKPLNPEELSQSVARGLGLAYQPASFFAALNNIAVLLQEGEAAIRDGLSSVVARKTLPQAVKHYCEEICPISLGEEDVRAGDFNQYRLLNPFSSRGGRYCDRRERCALWHWLTMSWERREEVFTGSLDEFFHRSIPFYYGTSRMEALSSLVERLVNQVLLLDQWRIRYCNSVCDQMRKDIAIQRGDILFSSFQEALEQNRFEYCRQKDCPLMSFFEYYRRSVL